MALSKTTSFKGISIPNAYHRVWGVEVTKASIKFGVGVHVTADDPILDNSHHTCDYDLNGDNPIKQAYEHLKTLPEFSDAEDV